MKLIKSSITRAYKKAATKLEKPTILEAKNIVKIINLADRIEHLPRADSFMTLKDHKDNFTNKATYRLIIIQRTNLVK